MQFSKSLLSIFVALAVATDPNNNNGGSTSTIAAGQATTTSNGDHNGDGNNKSSSTMMVSASKSMGNHSFTRISIEKFTNISFSASTVSAGQATSSSNGDHNGDGNNKSSSTMMVSASKSTGSHSLTRVSMGILLTNEQLVQALQAPRPLLRLPRLPSNPRLLLTRWPLANISPVRLLQSSWALRRWPRIAFFCSSQELCQGPCDETVNDMDRIIRHSMDSWSF